MDNTQRRTEERAPFATAVDYTYAYSEDDKLKCHTSVGITTNLSNRGLGFYTYAPMPPGQALTVFSRKLSPEPINAETRWCSQISEGIFKVGLRLSSPVLVTAARAEEAEKEAPAVEEVAGENLEGAIANIRAQLETLQTRLDDRVEGLVMDKERLQALSVTDDLTGIHNRRYFFERLEAESNLLDRYGHTLSVIIMDIDNFKLVNDRFGHLVGDAVLREFAEIVKRGLRKGDIFARYGGEEFAAILPHTSGRAALAAAENIRRTVAATVFSAVKGRVRLTVSIGVTEIGEKVRTPQEAVKRADRALYEAKIRGKNIVLLWPKQKDRVD